MVWDRVTTKTCQEVGWKEKGHRADCKLLKDPDLQGLFALKWDEFDDHVQFPLRVADGLTPKLNP